MDENCNLRSNNILRHVSTDDQIQVYYLTVDWIKTKRYKQELLSNQIMTYKNSKGNGLFLITSEVSCCKQVIVNRKQTDASLRKRHVSETGKVKIDFRVQKFFKLETWEINPF